MMLLPRRTFRLLLPLLMIAEAASFLRIDNYDKCSASQCAPIDEWLTNNVDRYQEPCYDFYKYACGYNKADQYSNEMAKRLSESQSYSRQYNAASFSDKVNPGWNRPISENALETLLNDDGILDESEKALSAYMIERDIFTLCKSKLLQGRGEAAEYSDVLREYGADRLQSSSHRHQGGSSNEDWRQVDSKYARDGFGFALFDVSVRERQADSGRVKRYIEISPPSADDYERCKSFLSRKESHFIVGHRARSEAGGQNFATSLSHKYSQLKKFIDKLKNLALAEQFNQAALASKQTTIANWNVEYDGKARDSVAKIDWASTLFKLFNQHQAPISDAETIVIKSDRYFSELANVLHSVQSPDTIINFIHLRFMSKIIGFVDTDFEREYAMIPKIEGLTCTPGLMVGAANVYTQKYFVDQNIESLERIFNATKTRVAKSLRDIAPNDPEGFVRGLETARVLIGCPKWVTDVNVVSRFYEGFQKQNSYLRNQMEAIKSLLKFKLKSLSDDSLPIIDMDEFYNSFMEDGIVISNKFEEIKLPARAFGEDVCPLCSAQLYSAITYGGIGTYIASKLYFHYFNEMSYFDTDSSPRSCLTEQFKKEMKYSLGLIDYENYDNKLNKRKAAAYLLGAQVAYEVWPDKNMYPVEFDIFGGMTVHRLYFLSLAQSMCASKDPLTPGELHPRQLLNFVVENMPSFNETFYCEDEKFHPMNKKLKCDPLQPGDKLTTSTTSGFSSL